MARMKLVEALPEAARKQRHPMRVRRPVGKSAEKRAHGLVTFGAFV